MPINFTATYTNPNPSYKVSGVSNPSEYAWYIKNTGILKKDIVPALGAETDTFRVTLITKDGTEWVNTYSSSALADAAITTLKAFI